MGHSRRSSSAHVLAASAVAGAVLLTWFSFQLSEVHDTAPRQSPKFDGDKDTLAPGARFTPKELAYTDDILDSDLLRPAPLFALEAAAQGLQYQFMSQGFNHQSALVISLHNANHESSITVDLPAGMLLAPAENRDFQNLVLRDAVHLSLLPGESKRVEQWAFCGNQYHTPPMSEEMKPTGWTLDAPPCQNCIWKATLPYETAVTATEGNWMAAKYASALAV